METKSESKPVCGIVMPISSIDGCSESHWTDVFDIISRTIRDAGFEFNLVSNADDIGVIQKRIIQNLYDNPIVVCDVSGKNPNVMFELGIRLAFDKPTIIIKDDKTTYSFDTAPIEHIEYPRDLRFNRIEEFKKKLKDKIISTHEKASKDPSFSTFLKHFGEFKVAKIDTKEVTQQEFIMDELKSLRNLILSNQKNNRDVLTYRKSDLGRYEKEMYREDMDNDINICQGEKTLNDVKEKIQTIKKVFPEIRNIEIIERSPDHRHIIIPKLPSRIKDLYKKDIESYLMDDIPELVRDK